LMCLYSIGIATITSTDDVRRIFAGEDLRHLRVVCFDLALRYGPVPEILAACLIAFAKAEASTWEAPPVRVARPCTAMPVPGAGIGAAGLRT